LITRSEADGLREPLLAVLAENEHHPARLLARLDAITSESGIGARAALLLILTRLAFDEKGAARHWEALLAHREQMSRRLGRDAGVRVAVLDYFLNVDRSLVHPTLIDLVNIDSVEREAGIDPLTGLASGRRFRAALPAELRRANRYDQRVSVVVIDVDDFARANATHGRPVGDRMLGELATLLDETVRDIDLAARLGEDEMVLLLPETDRDGALLVAERYRGRVESHFAAGQSAGVQVGLTVSSGVACYPDDAATPEALLEAAAQGLYHAKAAGRNRVQPSSPRP